MNQISSPLGDIYIGNLSEGLQAIPKQLNASSVVIIADENTLEHCVPFISEHLTITKIVTIPPGDQHKNLESCALIWSALLESGADRSCLVLNVGGGMICDIGGFAASCYQRGIRFAHVPTSLLAMTDAALGGKTGINFSGYKNYIGRFEAPAFIWIDPVFLRTLSSGEMINGMAEMVKHAIIGSPPLWNLLSAAPSVDAMDWPLLIEMNTAIKRIIVEDDPYEHGVRKTLNFGHTIGHALESYFLETRSPLSHGQAVTLGMLAETRLSYRLGILDLEDFERIIALIQRLLRPSEVTLPSIESLRPWLNADKKKHKGAVGFSLPNKIGACIWDVKVEEYEVEESLNWLGAHLSAASIRLKED